MINEPLYGCWLLHFDRQLNQGQSCGQRAVHFFWCVLRSEFG
jgi:hypothetical protein